MDSSTRSGTEHRWWHGAVLYQMSVRSWLDTGQDGYGDAARTVYQKSQSGGYSRARPGSVLTPQVLDADDPPSGSGPSLPPTRSRAIRATTALGSTHAARSGSRRQVCIHAGQRT